jgi:RimJ/RimL family protein N-acetyltransferase
MARRVEAGKMIAFEIPTVVTERLRLRAFRADDLDAYAAMQANPGVMHHPFTGSAAICGAG